MNKISNIIPCNSDFLWHKESLNSWIRRNNIPNIDKYFLRITYLTYLSGSTYE